MKTLLIACWALIPVTSDGKTVNKYRITCEDGTVVWANENQFDTNAETVSFKIHKPGDTFTATKDNGDIYKKGETVTRLKETIEYVGCGKQIVKKSSSLDLMKLVLEAGVSPTFAN